jgi:hypothetical protein
VEHHGLSPSDARRMKRIKTSTLRALLAIHPLQHMVPLPAATSTASKNKAAAAKDEDEEDAQMIDSSTMDYPFGYKKPQALSLTDIDAAVKKCQSWTLCQHVSNKNTHTSALSCADIHMNEIKQQISLVEESINCMRHLENNGVPCKGFCCC